MMEFIIIKRANISTLARKDVFLMKQTDFKVSFPQLVCTLSDAVDLVSPVLNNHHKQVAYISYKIAEVLGLSSEEKADLLAACLLHDIGAMSLNQRIELLEFEEKNPYAHTISGYILLKDLETFQKAGEIIKHHHLPWGYGEGVNYKGEQVHLESHIIYLADRIAVSIDKNKNILNQKKDILARIKAQAGSRFHPQFVEIFESISAVEAFWLDLVSPTIKNRLEAIWKDCKKELNLKELLGITKIFARIIDFKSRFTSLHSSGVKAVAGAIAAKMGWPEEDCIKIKIAGNLHDLGKLTVPGEILEKPGKLTDKEYNIIKAHTYHSYYLLKGIEGLEEINEFGAFHHERMDGKGYPFQIQGKDLKEGSRIIAIADVFTALTEDRPYREGMNETAAMGIIEEMGKDLKLDAGIVALTKDNFEEINFAREVAQQQAAREYEYFDQETCMLRSCYY